MKYFLSLLLTLSLVAPCAAQFPTGWGRRVALTIDSAQVVGTHTDLAIPIRREFIPDEVCSPTDANAAQSDGDDIRFSSNEDGSTQIAHEVVNFEHDSADGAGDANIELHVKAPSVTSGGDTTIYMWYKNAGASAQAIDSTYGAENVWDAKHIGVWHLPEDPNTDTMLDSTSNDQDGTATGFATGQQQPHILGSAVLMDNVDSNIDVTDNATLDITTGLTLTAFVEATHLRPTNQPLIDKFFDNTDRAYYLWTNAGDVKIALGTADGSGSTTLNPTDHEIEKGQQALVATTWDGTTIRSHVGYAYPKVFTGLRPGPSVTSGTPVIALGAASSWEETGVRDNCFMRDTTDNSLVYESGNAIMYYRGIDGSSNRRIGRATSDGSDLSTWNKYGSNPVFDDDSSNDVHGCSVIKKGASDYVMWYITDPGATMKLMRATSTDGLSWTTDSNNPILDSTDFSDISNTAAAGVPYIYYSNNRSKYVIVFEATSTAEGNLAIFGAEATNEATPGDWAVLNSGNAILGTLASTQDAENVANPSLYDDPNDTNSFLLAYNGSLSSNDYHLRVAKCTDGTLTNWTRWGGDVLDPADQSWHSYRIESLRFVPETLGAGTVEYCYFGSDVNSGTTDHQIGYATIDQTWTDFETSATTASKTDNLGTNTEDLHIGEDYNDDDHAAWTFDEARVLDQGLSANELQTVWRFVSLDDMITAGTPQSVGDSATFFLNPF